MTSEIHCQPGSLEGVEKLFALHSNWVADHGELKSGDKVQYVEAKHESDYLLLDKLDKVSEESFEEKMKNLVEGEQ